jgi:hypothetical protein
MGLQNFHVRRRRSHRDEHLRLSSTSIEWAILHRAGPGLVPGGRDGFSQKRAMAYFIRHGIRKARFEFPLSAGLMADESPFWPRNVTSGYPAFYFPCLDHLAGSSVAPCHNAISWYMFVATRAALPTRVLVPQATLKLPEAGASGLKRASDSHLLCRTLSCPGD